MSTRHEGSSSGWTTRTKLHIATLTVSVIVFLLVQIEVPDPYLDEIFHIPQTQRYCDEDFEFWDPAITTPPGLYLLSAIPLMTVHVPCTVALLRGTNLLFSTLVIPGIVSCLFDTSRSTAAWKHFAFPSVQALVISTFPLISFFSNLYYTDIGSLAGVLGALLLARRDRHWSAVLVGTWSMTVRQTNVVWLAFIMTTCVLEKVRKLEKSVESSRSSDCMLDDVKGPEHVIRLCLETVQGLFTHMGSLISTILPYILPFTAFVAFLKWNGGIVLGHKDQHEAAIHLPQLLYFVAFSSVLLLPTLLDNGPVALLSGATRTGLGTPKRLLGSIVAVSSMLFAVHRFTIYHPFLLADNRHYVFYVLRRVFLPYPAAKYAVVPLYLAASWAWFWRLGRHATILWTLALVGCTTLTLVPSPLIEPRYFLIPSLLLRIQLPTRAWRSELAWYTLINTVTISVFLLKKFRWEGWEGWMRFMW